LVPHSTSPVHWIAFLVLVPFAIWVSLSGSNQQQNPTTNSPSIPENKNEDSNLPIEFHVTVFPNGGNNSGEPSYSIQVRRNSLGWQRFVESSKNLVYKNENISEVTVYNRWGELIKNGNSLQPNESYFLVPKGHWFFWPGMYVGYKVQLRTLPYSNPNKILAMETLSLIPRLFKIDNFLTDDEANYVIKIAAPKMEKSHVVEDDGGKLHKSRTSSSTWLWKNEGNVITDIDKRVANLTHIPTKERLEEAMQVVHYLPGQFYQSHLDWFDPKVHVSNPDIQAGVNRMITVFYYLNTVEEGGETIFPHAGPTGYKLQGEYVDMADCSKGIGVKPTKGNAILWYSLTAKGHMKGEGDYASLHGACPPVSGEKYGANKWIWSRKKLNGGHSYDNWSDSELS